MSSSDSAEGAAGVESRIVRTTGLQPTVEETSGSEREEDFDATGTSGEVRRLRARVGELEGELARTTTALAARETRIEELTADLESARRERDDARQWAGFLDRELREHRDRVETLEGRVAALESSGTGVIGRLRRLFG